MDVRNILILFFVFGIFINLCIFMMIIYNMRFQNLKGPDGEDGPKGPRGPRGPKGPIGLKSAFGKGPRGHTGLQGRPGIPIWGFDGEKKIISGMNAIGCSENKKCRIPGQICIGGANKVNTICCNGTQKRIDYSKVDTDAKIKNLNCGNIRSSGVGSNSNLSLIHISEPTRPY